MANRTRNRIPRVEVACKSPAEDFLFILVICLATTLVFFAKTQKSNRFALAERRGEAQMLAPEEYEQLPKCVLAAEGGIEFAGTTLQSSAELIQHLSHSGLDTDSPVLLRIHRDRSIGELEDTKNAFLDRNIKVLIEWELHP